jgi:prephenate dehydratase
MREVMEGRVQNVAAVGFEGGLRQYGLKVIATGIENPARNETVFLLLKKADKVSNGHVSSSTGEDATDGRSHTPS